MKWISMASHELIVQAMQARIDALEKDRDRWHREAVQWRETMKPVRTNVPGAVLPVPVDGPPPLPERVYSEKLMQAVNDEVRWSGEPSTRTFMMAAVDKLLDSGLTDDEVLQAVRQGDSMATA